MVGEKVSRAERAANTRARILDAAYDSFAADGYRRTTMQGVADRSGVAVQTVYFVFRTKDDLLAAVQERAVIGDERIPPTKQPDLTAALAEPDLGPAVHLFVRGTMAILERTAPLVPTWLAVAGEPVGEIWRHSERLRHEGYAEVVAALIAKAPIRAGLSPAEAVDIVFTLLGPDTYRVLVGERGWTPRAFATWVEGAIVEQVFLTANH